jgi:hypothetical protein
MADDVNAPGQPATPPPAPEPQQVAPPSPGKGDDAAAAAKKPPTKMILAAVGGLAAVVVVILLVMLVVSLFTTSYSVPGTSPKLTGDVKDAAKSYLTFKEEKRWNQMEMAMKYEADDLSEEEDLIDFYEDKDQFKKDLTRTKNQISFFKDNKKELKKFEFADETTKEEGGRTVYSCTVKGKRMVPDGDEKWKLEDRADKKTLTFAKINGEWKLVGGGAD